MKIIVTEDYEAMSAEAAKIFADVIRKKPDCVLGLATGSTPVGLYRDLAAANLDFSAVKSVNLDEYYPIAPENEQSYRYFMNENLFDKVNIDKKNTFVPDGKAQDPAEAAKRHEAQIDAFGGIDVQILGIGRNGHIGFNEPDESGLLPETHLQALTPSTIAANSRFFASEDDVPKHALTMGMGSIFKARKVVIMASGADKADAVRAMLAGKITPTCPASFLLLHPDVTLVCDKAAYALVK